MTKTKVKQKVTARKASRRISTQGGGVLPVKPQHISSYPSEQEGPITKRGVAAFGITVLGAGAAVAGAAMAAPVEVGIGMGAAVIGTGLKVYDTVQMRKHR